MSHIFINDLFWTLQGEGYHWGRRALFVRMPYCNLACSWCDTSFNSYKKWAPEDFDAFAQQEPARFAVITGGEPMMNRHTPVVVSRLKALGFYLACETNGTFPIVSGIDYVTCSPKRDAEYFVHEDAYHLVSEFKYVVDDGFDFSILDRHVEPNYSNARLTLSPEYGGAQANIQKILGYIKEHPQWRLSLQTHKYLGIP